MTSPLWSPEQDLSALLDALTEDLLGAADREVTLSLHDVGEDPAAAVRDMRRLVAAAATEAAALPMPGPPAHPGRVAAARLQ